jgi:hypothetical protein
MAEIVLRFRARHFEESGADVADARDPAKNILL